MGPTSPSDDRTLGPTAEAEASLRRSVYALLICATMAAVVGRLLTVDEHCLSANDRSRWSTVRALVDDGTYAIGKRESRKKDTGIVTEKGWHTIDLVLHPETRTFYSSKPPLLSTAAAGCYWVIKQTTGWSIVGQRWLIYWGTLLVFNCVPLAIYLVLLTQLVEVLGTTHWGRLYIATAACFGTFLTTFAVVLNNHIPAACCVLFAVYQAVQMRLVPDAERLGSRCAAAGFFAGCAAATDLPATAFLAWLWVSVVRRARGESIWFLVGAVVPIIAFLVTNYMAIGRWTPAYGEFGGPWYEFEGSYWAGKTKDGIDNAGTTEGKFDYFFHLLFGHHGLFSLTPVFLLIFFAPAPTEPVPRSGPAGREETVGWLWTGTIVLATIVVTFYLYKTSNYGGFTCGPRWLFWLTPLLLLSALPAADVWGASPGGRRLGYVLLGLSVLSATYPGTRPWSHPWLYHLMHSQGMISY